MSIVVAVALLVVAIAAIVVLDPFATSYSGTLKLSIVNYNDGPRSCSVFIDGQFARNETVNGGVGAPTYAPGSEILTIKVSWKEAATHQCSIEVFSSGTRYATSVWIADGLTASAHFRIGYGFF